jgi:hypothetical protein
MMAFVQNENTCKSNNLQVVGEHFVNRRQAGDFRFYK